MKLFTEGNFSFFWDRNYRHWVLYPINSDGTRKEWDVNDNPIESEYFTNKIDLKKHLNNKNKTMELQLNKEIQVTAIQYKKIGEQLQGYVDFRHDTTNNNFYIKIWHKGAIPIVKQILNP